MKVVGLVTEYNPFHNGHLHHLNKSKEMTGCDYSVAVMSGNFLQRGEPALVDKWSRTKMAIENGVDLVIELPTVYSCQSAEYFAYSAVKILDSLGIVNHISFGSEAGDLGELNLIADILHREPIEFKNALKNKLDTGIPFPQARSEAVILFIESSSTLTAKAKEEIKEIMSNPNNILAIEYLKALKKINSTIIPTTIKRIGAHYSSKNIEGNFSSATSIRKKIFETNNISYIKGTVPSPTYNILEESYKKYGSFNRIENYNEVLTYLLRTINPKSLKKILDVDEGLENRIKRCASKFNNIDSILECINTKRYTYTRIQRILMHLLLDINEDTFLELHNLGPLYIRVLGFNQKGIEILNKAKKIACLPIITKFANYQKIESQPLHAMIEQDIKATDIYFLGLKKYDEEKTNLDFFKSPYISK